MSNCSGELSNGLGIEAWAPVTHTDWTTDGMNILDGVVTLVNVSSSDVKAGKFPNPFRGQSRGDGGSDGWENWGSEVKGSVVLWLLCLGVIVGRARGFINCDTLLRQLRVC